MNTYETMKSLETGLIHRLCWIPDPHIILPHTVFVEDVNEKGEPEFFHCTLEAINPHEKTCTLINHANNERGYDWQLNAINIEWLLTLWEWYKEKKSGIDNPERLYLAETGEWKENAYTYLKINTAASIDEIIDFIGDHWQNLRSDEENLADFKLILGNQKKCGSNKTLAEEHISKTPEKKLYAFVWDMDYMPRNASDEEILRAYEMGESRSLIDPDNETLFEVEKLTPDELAERLNDEQYNDLQFYVRFIAVAE